MQKHYVYAFLRPEGHTPYYVGKGTGKRWRCWQRRVPRPRDNNRIKKVYETNCEADAVEVEATLIKFWGRLEDGGVLLNRQARGRKKGAWNQEQRRRAAKKRGTGLTLNGTFYLSRKEAQQALGVGWRNLDKLIAGEPPTDLSFTLDGKRYKSVLDASQKLGVKWDTIKRWRDRGGKPTHTTGRWANK